MTTPFKTTKLLRITLTKDEFLTALFGKDHPDNKINHLSYSHITNEVILEMEAPKNE